VRFADESSTDKPISEQSDDPTSAVQRALLQIAGQPKPDKVTGPEHLCSKLD